VDQGQVDWTPHSVLRWCNSPSGEERFIGRIGGSATRDRLARPLRNSLTRQMWVNFEMVTTLPFVTLEGAFDSTDNAR